MTSARRSPRRRLVGALAALSVACLAWSCRMHSADADFTSADHADATAPADGVTGSDGAPGAGPAAADGADQVLIGQVRWYVDYKAALAIARAKDQPLWVHFGENPGWEGCQHFASGPLRDPAVVEASAAFVPVFVDTLDRDQPYLRFGESFGSYPVLRVHDHEGNDLGGRLDGNAVRGRIPVSEVLGQLARGRAAWRR